MHGDVTNWNDKSSPSIPWSTVVSMGLMDWLRSDQRQDIPFLPRRYVSIMELLPRLCAFRLPGGEQMTPWFQEDVERELRQALSDGVVTAWLIVDGQEPIKVLSTAWLNWSVWHRAKFNRDMEKPDTDYDGDEVPEQAWIASERAAGPEGLYVVERDDVLRWLGFSASIPASAESPSVVVGAHGEVGAEEAELKRLKAALIAHFERPLPWVKKNELIEEIRRILAEHKLQKFIPHLHRLAEEIRPEEHKTRGNRSKHEQAEMKLWLKRMEKKRPEFKFLRADPVDKSGANQTESN